MDPCRAWVRRRSAMTGNATWSEHLGVAEDVGKRNWSCFQEKVWIDVFGLSSFGKIQIDPRL